ncbi:MAG: acetate--CoA ligase family protein, partial [Acidobacteriota bacterium]
AAAELPAAEPLPHQRLEGPAALAFIARAGIPIASTIGEGIETVLGMRHDPAFGPVVSLRLGGTLATLLDDTILRVAPLDLAEAKRMIGELAGGRILEDADIEALAQALVRLSLLAAAQGARLERLDIDPFLVLPRGRGALAVGAVAIGR